MKPRALVADDVATHQTALKSQLRIYGFDVDTADDGLEAWNKARVGEYDIIFTDLEMPNMNGLEFLVQVKKNPLTKRTAVIMLSMVANTVIIDKALRLGAADYLIKPFTSENISKVLLKVGFQKI